MKPKNGFSGHSCVYEGYIGHRRFQPRQHHFRYHLFMMYLDLAEIDTVFRGRWLWSTNRWALARFCRKDHFGDVEQPLDVCVRDLVEHETGRRPRGAIRLLTHLRYCGYCFNPISIYYCFAENGDQVEALVAEVTNTPWGQRHCYVLDGSCRVDQRHYYRFPKALHVSPFMPMDLDYVWRCNEPGEQLGVHMEVLRDEQKLFDATLGLRRRAISGPVLMSALVRFPLITLWLIAAIHWQALRLWLKQIPFFNHPVKTGKPLEG